MMLLKQICKQGLKKDWRSLYLFAFLFNIVIARYEAIPNYTGWICKSGIASYLAMTGDYFNGYPYPSYPL